MGKLTKREQGDRSKIRMDDAYQVKCWAHKLGIDRGRAKSRIGIVLVTPALLQRLPKECIADKELSVLLAVARLVPVVHRTTYEALREVSPMLASRTGLDTAEESMADVAAKLADLVAL
jgi:Protein of unknown function (DUF3606)